MNTREQIKRLTAIGFIAVFAALNFVGCTDVGNDPTIANSQTNTAAVANKDPNQAGAVDPPAANEVQIVIENFAFVPSELTVAPGTKITWINKDEAPHTATSTDKKFNSGGLDTDDKFSFVFNDKGEFPYFCALHPHMTATITVK